MVVSLIINPIYTLCGYFLGVSLWYPVSNNRFWTFRWAKKSTCRRCSTWQIRTVKPGVSLGATKGFLIVAGCFQWNHMEHTHIYLYILHILWLSFCRYTYYIIIYTYTYKHMSRKSMTHIYILLHHLYLYLLHASRVNFTGPFNFTSCCFFWGSQTDFISLGFLWDTGISCGLFFFFPKEGKFISVTLKVGYLLTL